MRFDPRVSRLAGMAVAVFGLMLTGSRATAQLTFQFSFADVTTGSGFGFDDPTQGLARRQALDRAAAYLSSVLDSRSTVQIDWLQSDNSPGSTTLASCGAYFSGPSSGSISNGFVFRHAMTGVDPSGSVPDADGSFNFGKNFFNGPGTNPASNQFDLQSVALHEMSHALGFSSNFNSNGTGLAGNLYTRFDSFLRLGPNANDPLLLNTANFTLNSSVGTAGLVSNNVYFSGEFTRAANAGNAQKIFAPNPFDNGSSLAHVDDDNMVMNPSTGPGAESVKRAYNRVELAMMIDIGWNNFTWNSTTGNWADNVSNTTTPRWQNVDAQNALSPVGTITTDLVLRFGGTGTQQYTSTNGLALAATPATNNDANRFLVNRIVLNSTSSNGQTIASNGTNVLRFGSTIGIAPQIQQLGSGAFTISHASELTNAGLILGGPGAGAVNMTGAIGQQSGTTGAISKTGTSTFNLSGSNTYAGATFINAGTIGVASLANGGAASAIGQSSNAADNLVLNGGTLRYTGTGHATDRLFTLNAGGGTIDASGTGAVNFTNTGAINVANPGTVALPIVNGSTFVPVSFANGAKLAVGMTVSGTGIPGGTTVTAVGSDLITLSNAATATNGAANLTFGGTNRILTLTGTNTGANRIAGSLANPTGNTLSLVKSGAGSWTLAGTNSYTGSTTVSAGTLTAGSSSAFGTNSVTSVAGTLQTGGFNITLGSLSGNGTVENANAAPAVLTVGTLGSNTAYSGSIRDGTGGGSLALTKVGAGTLALNGANPLTGPTTVSAGTLLVNGNIGAGSNVAVNNEGRLGGTGTVNGTISVNAGGTIAPGASIGTLTTGSVVFNGNGSYHFEYNRLTGGALDPGVEADRILSFADLTFNATPASPFTINLSYIGPGPFTGQAPTTAVLASFTSEPTINTAAFVFTGDVMGAASVTVIDNDLVINFTPVPEPATILGLTALGWLAARVRRFGLPR